MIHWRRNRSAVGYPPYICQPVLAFLPNSFGFLMHRGGRDARVPVHAASRQLSAVADVGGLVYRYVIRSRCRRAIMIYWQRYSPRKPGGRLPTLRSPNTITLRSPAH
ncbi:MAG: hypothetical protein LBQ66_05730 [Planctomycetaceae bacterium]|nr:hypothetical protein [Planctomycetaceae bacterium]